MWSSPVWILLLSKLIVTGAVVSNCWICYSWGLAIGEGHSLVEIWAMRKAGMRCSPVWIIELNISSLLIKLKIWVAVETNLWVWYTLSSSILESKSFIEVGAVLQSLNITCEGAGSWVLVDLDEGISWGILLHFAGSTNIWVLGDVRLAIVHDGSA